MSTAEKEEKNAKSFWQLTCTKNKVKCDKCSIRGIDDGKGSIKILLTMYEKDNIECNVKKRVKRIKVLYKVRNVQEYYYNMAWQFYST